MTFTDTPLTQPPANVPKHSSEPSTSGSLNNIAMELTPQELISFAEAVARNAIRYDRKNRDPDLELDDPFATPLEELPPFDARPSPKRAEPLDLGMGVSTRVHRTTLRKAHEAMELLRSAYSSNLAVTEALDSIQALFAELPTVPPSDHETIWTWCMEWCQTMGLSPANPDNWNLANEAYLNCH